MPSGSWTTYPSSGPVPVDGRGRPAQVAHAPYHPIQLDFQLLLDLVHLFLPLRRRRRKFIGYTGTGLELAPRPPTWYETDDVYIDYTDDGYFVYDRVHPGPLREHPFHSRQSCTERTGT